jgi:Cys-tRNA(Pro)/Cys-tRNA(Cys) deacylase
MKKTQAMRMLEAECVDYRAVEYDSSGAFHSGEGVAALVGAELETVYKTLVVLREGGGGKAMLVLIPVAEQLDMKILASEVSAKKLRMATQREAEKLTGLQVGGISALAVPPGRFEVLIDERARALARFHVSAGARGLDLELAVADLMRLTGGRFVRAVRQETTL